MKVINYLLIQSTFIIVLSISLNLEHLLNFMQKKLFVLIIMVLVIFLLGISLGIYITPKDNIAKEGNKVFNGEVYKDISIVGVDGEGNGLSGKISVEVKPGNGLVLVNINNLLADYLTQLSARNAAKIASNLTNVNLKFIDIIYNVKANASTIEGPSAGAAMTLATIAALSNRSVNESVFISGTIDENGTIGIVGGLGEKAKAAKENGASLFLIPYAGYTSGYDKTESCKKLNEFNYCEINYVPKSFDLSKLLNLSIIQVKNITQAMEYSLK